MNNVTLYSHWYELVWLSLAWTETICKTLLSIISLMGKMWVSMTDTQKITQCDTFVLRDGTVYFPQKTVQLCRPNCRPFLRVHSDRLSARSSLENYTKRHATVFRQSNTHRWSVDNGRAMSKLYETGETATCPLLLGRVSLMFITPPPSQRCDIPEIKNRRVRGRSPR